MAQLTRWDTHQRLRSAAIMVLIGGEEHAGIVDSDVWVCRDDALNTWPLTVDATVYLEVSTALEGVPLYRTRDDALAAQAGRTVAYVKATLLGPEPVSQSDDNEGA